jgi:hypothetical protein
VIDLVVTNLTDKPLTLAVGDASIPAKSQVTISTAVIPFPEVLRAWRRGDLSVDEVLSTVTGLPYTDLGLKPDVTVTNVSSARVLLPLSSEGGGVIELAVGETDIVSTFEVDLSVIVDSVNDGAITLDAITNTVAGAEYTPGEGIGGDVLFGQFEVDNDGNLLLHYVVEPVSTDFEITDAGFLEVTT